MGPLSPFRLLARRARGNDGLAPHAASVVSAVLVDQFLEKRKRARQDDGLPKAQESLPHRQARFRLVNGREEIESLEIRVRVGRKHLVEKLVDVLARTPGARNGERQKRPIRSDGAPKFRISFRVFLLAQKKIPVVKSDLRGDRIRGFRLKKGVPRASRISGGRPSRVG